MGILEREGEMEKIVEVSIVGMGGVLGGMVCLCLFKYC